MIAGRWTAARNWHGEVADSVHFVKRGTTIGMCGKGRQLITGRRGIALIQALPVLGRAKCERCLACIAAELRHRKEAKKQFEKLYDKLQKREPAIAQQVLAVWPIHAQEDHSAEWWETSAPAMIQNMKEALRGGRDA